MVENTEDKLRRALKEIVDGYGPNHGSKWCFQTADEALAATQEQGGEWQPIESAPKDSTRIIVGWLGCPGVNRLHWNSRFHEWRDEDGAAYETPTHWQPLPSPPTDAGKGAAASSSKREGQNVISIQRLEEHRNVLRVANWQGPADALTDAIHEISALRAAVAAERERCARIVEGDVYKERYRKWPCIGGGNQGEDSDLVKYFLDPLAAAIRRGVSPIAGTSSKRDAL